MSGDTFDTMHHDNDQPCGRRTIQAIITDGRVTAGTASEGILRVNALS